MELDTARGVLKGIALPHTLHRTQERLRLGLRWLRFGMGENPGQGTTQNIGGDVEAQTGIVQKPVRALQKVRQPL